MMTLVTILLVLLPWQWALPTSWGDIPWFRLAAGALLVYGLASALVVPEKLRFEPRLLFPLIGFLGCAMLSILLIPGSAFEWERKFVFLTGLLPLMLVWPLWCTVESGRKLVTALLTGAVTSALFGLGLFLAQFIVGIETLFGFLTNTLAPFFLGERLAQLVVAFPSLLVNIGGATWLRVTAVFPDPHVASFFFGMTACLALGYFFEERRWTGLVAALILLVADLLTFSRGGYLGLAAAVGLVGSFRMVSQYRLRLALIAAGFLPLIIWGALPVLSRFFSIFTLADTSSLDRFTLWAAAWEVWQDHFFFGVGLGQYATTVHPFTGASLPYYAHNLYLDLGVELGIFGLGFFLALLLVAWNRVWTRARSGEGLSLGILAALTVYLVHSLFETALFSIHVTVLLTMVLALAFIPRQVPASGTIEESN